MKNIKNLFLAIILLLTPIFVFAETLTIDTKSYNENTNVLTISGSSGYSEVMVSLFDADNNLLSFKTVESQNDNYSVTFNIAFDEDKTITIKVGDINSTDYKISTLDVKKSVEPVKPSKLTDDGGNSLTILDSLKKFDFKDELVIEIMDDFSDLESEEQKLLEAIQEKLGSMKKLAGIMIVSVVNKGEEVELPEVNDGYQLFLNIDEETLAVFTKPYTARLLDLEKFEFEKEQLLKYSKDDEGVVLKLNNIGIYVLYDDTSIDYNFLDNTDNQDYNLKKGDNLTIRVDADYDKFINVYVDDELVDPKYYTSKSGSTIITFTQEYLQTLSLGTHNIKVNFTDGEANTTFKIVNLSNPQTGDYVLKYVLISLISLIGISSGIIYLKKKKMN